MGDFLGGNSPGGKCPAVVLCVGIFWRELFFIVCFTSYS